MGWWKAIKARLKPCPVVRQANVVKISDSIEWVRDEEETGDVAGPAANLGLHVDSGEAGSLGNSQLSVSDDFSGFYDLESPKSDHLVPLNTIDKARRARAEELIKRLQG